MKKVLSLLLILSITMAYIHYNAYSQGDKAETNNNPTQMDSAANTGQNQATGTTTEKNENQPEEVHGMEEPAETPAFGHELLKKWFIDGDPLWMTLPLICLILGLAFAIERIIMLSLATTNARKLLDNIEGELKSGNVDGAKEICRKNRSPIASIIFQGLDRVHEGIEIVEKSIVSYGSVQMGLLEKGLVWISLFIALAPMLGFMGTVVGMVKAFDAIEAAGDISPSLVAGGIKVALLTTLFGLIVAVILQIFYNYIISKIDSIVNKMEDASITFVDILVKYNIK